MSDGDQVSIDDVVVVDDDDLTLELIKRRLRDTPLNVRCFSDQEGALEYLDDHPTKVLLVDQRMPRQCGLEFLQELAERSGITATRAFLCSAIDLPDSIRVAARSLGVRTLNKDVYQSKEKLEALLHEL